MIELTKFNCTWYVVDLEQGCDQNAVKITSKPEQNKRKKVQKRISLIFQFHFCTYLMGVAFIFTLVGPSKGMKRRFLGPENNMYLFIIFASLVIKLSCWVQIATK